MTKQEQEQLVKDYNEMAKELRDTRELIQMIFDNMENQASILEKMNNKSKAGFFSRFVR